jgi:putative sterol carrier protein
MFKVKTGDPGTLNVAGLIIKELIETNLANPSKLDRVKSMDTLLGIRASGMCLSIRFKGGEVSIENGFPVKPNVTISADIGDFVSLGAGSLNPLPILTGRIKLGGNVFKLIPLLGIITV